MRIVAAIAMFLFGSVLWAQGGLWSQVPVGGGQQRLEPAKLTDDQVKSVGELLRRQKDGSIWECEGPDLDELIKGLRFESIPLNAGRNVVLAEAGRG